MSALIRILSSDYNPLRDHVALHVEVMHVEDPDLDKAYVVVLPVKLARDVDTLKKYIEEDIISQHEAVPNWSGFSWKSATL